MTEIQLAVARLVKLHGTWRAAAQKSGVDLAYLHRLHSGQRENPSEEILEKLGLRRRFSRIAPQRNCAA